jgi:homoserine O-acetyltransferase
MDAAVAMTPMAKTSPWAAVVLHAARNCLMADAAWTGERFDGVPERGWRAYAGLMQALIMRTPEAVDAECEGRDLQAWFDAVAAQQRAQDFDATDFLYQSWAYEAHDVGTTPGFDGDTERALRSIRARTLILAPPLDLFNPVAAARAAAQAIPGPRLVEIPSRQGHYAATSLSPDDAAFLDRTLAAFLAA